MNRVVHKSEDERRARAKDALEEEVNKAYKKWDQLRDAANQALAAQRTAERHLRQSVAAAAEFNQLTLPGTHAPSAVQKRSCERGKKNTKVEGSHDDAPANKNESAQATASSGEPDPQAPHSQSAVGLTANKQHKHRQAS